MTNFADAQAKIMDLHARYVDAVWRKDFDLVGELFDEDGEWVIAEEILRGRPAIMAFIKRALSKTEAILVTLRTPILEVGDGVASGRTFFTAQNILTDGRVFTPIGMYYDRFVERGDVWKFKWRHFQTLYSSFADGQPGRMIAATNYGRPPAMPPVGDLPTADGSLPHSRANQVK